MKITNTGVAPLSYFADGRLDTVGDVRLAELSGQNTDIALPVPVGVYPYWLIPPDFSQLTVAASGTQPVNLDVGYNSGGPDVYSAAQGNRARPTQRRGTVHRPVVRQHRTDRPVRRAGTDPSPRPATAGCSTRP